MDEGFPKKGGGSPKETDEFFVPPSRPLAWPQGSRRWEMGVDDEAVYPDRFDDVLTAQA
jgi:hypothetical protein